MDDMNSALASLGVTADQAAKALNKALSKISLFTEEDISLVKMNPNLSLLQKYRIIKNMKKLKET